MHYPPKSNSNFFYKLTFIQLGNFSPDQLKYIVAIGNNGELPSDFKIG